MSPQGGGLHPRIIGIRVLSLTAETVLYRSTIALGGFSMPRDSRQVEPASPLSPTMPTTQTHLTDRTAAAVSVSLF